MSSVVDKREEGAVQAALINPIVLRRIFFSLDVKDLKQCRLVRKLWDVEAGYYMREFRTCHVSITGDEPCSKLKTLIDSVSQRPSAPVFNSMEIRIGCPRDCKSELKNKLEIYLELRRHLHLRHLRIYWSCNYECPSFQLFHTLLFHSYSDLQHLKLANCSEESDHFSHLGCIPKLPSLKVLELESVARSAKGKTFLLELISAAPNLQKLKGNFDSRSLAGLPEESWRMLDHFSLSVYSEEEERDCFRFADVGPKLSSLAARPPAHYSQLRYVQGFSRVLEKLLTSSCKTLEKFRMGPEVILLDFLSYPPLVNLKLLEVLISDGGDEPIGFLQSINFTKLMPSLCKVEVTSYVTQNRVVLLPNEVLNAFQRDFLSSSTSVKEMTVWAHFNAFHLRPLSVIFPELITLELRPMGAQSPIVPFGNLWAAWPRLEYIYVVGGGNAQGRNLDAEFLGIHPEEVEFLRNFEEESLEKLSIVPIRPSVLTMNRLKILKITRSLLSMSVFLRPCSSALVPIQENSNQGLLSRLTKILAFKKMAAMGIKIELT